MRRGQAMLADPATYRASLYLLTGLPLGIMWFVALVVAWSLCASFAITPLVIPLLLGTAAMTRGFAAVEAALARTLLGADARTPPARRGAPASGRGSGPRSGAASGARRRSWRSAGWSGSRSASPSVSLLVTELGMIVAPAWVPFVHGGAQLGFWRPHTSRSRSRSCRPASSCCR